MRTHPKDKAFAYSGMVADIENAHNTFIVMEIHANPL